MTVSIDGHDLGQLVEIAAWTGSVLLILVVGLILYLMVRPVRKGRAEREAPIAADEMLQLMERMENRLETLERAVRSEGVEANRPQSPGPHGLEQGRME